MDERLDDLARSFGRDLRAAKKAPRTVELYGMAVPMFVDSLEAQGRPPVLSSLTRHATRGGSRIWRPARRPRFSPGSRACAASRAGWSPRASWTATRCRPGAADPGGQAGAGALRRRGQAVAQDVLVARVRRPARRGPHPPAARRRAAYKRVRGDRPCRPRPGRRGGRGHRQGSSRPFRSVRGADRPGARPVPPPAERAPQGPVAGALARPARAALPRRDRPPAPRAGNGPASRDCTRTGSGTHLSTPSLRQAARKEI
jgi:hypothetical protein